MIRSFTKITVRHVRKPVKKDLNNDLQWIGDSLGLFGIRDKDKSCFRLFIELLKSTRQGKPLSSDELAYKLNLSRGTVVHHLNKLMTAGLVVSDRNKYLLRDNNMENLIEDLRADVERTFDELRKMAEDIDDSLGFERRKKKEFEVK